MKITRNNYIFDEEFDIQNTLLKITNEEKSPIFIAELIWLEFSSLESLKFLFLLTFINI